MTLSTTHFSMNPERNKPIPWTTIVFIFRGRIYIMMVRIMYDFRLLLKDSFMSNLKSVLIYMITSFVLHYTCHGALVHNNSRKKMDNV